MSYCLICNTEMDDYGGGCDCNRLFVEHLIYRDGGFRMIAVLMRMSGVSFPLIFDLFQSQSIKVPRDLDIHRAIGILWRRLKKNFPPAYKNNRLIRPNTSVISDWPEFPG